MEDIDKKIVGLQEDLLKIKEVQRSQNDSFKFYAFQTENLWNSLPHGFPAVRIYLEFRPHTKPMDKVVCRFFVSDGSAIQYSADMLYNVDPNNHLKATYDFDGYDPPSAPPSFMQFCYLGCYTNCDGDFIWST